MKKIIFLVPGLNNKFDSFIFNTCKDFAKENNLLIQEVHFAKYEKTGQKFDSTFNEQTREIRNAIKKEKAIIVAKSLGAIPAILARNKNPLILISPTISIDNEKDIFDTKFSNIKTEPIKINNERLKDKISIIYGDTDQKIDVFSLRNLKGVRLIEIKSEKHSLKGEEVKNALKKELINYV